MTCSLLIGIARVFLLCAMLTISNTVLRRMRIDALAQWAKSGAVPVRATIE
jgi:hypothetical protein